MKFNGLRPMLLTDKLKETIDFYVNILEFTCVESNDDWSWASLQKDNVEIMLTKPNAHTQFDKPLFTGSFYINTNMWMRHGKS